MIEFIIGLLFFASLVLVGAWIVFHRNPRKPQELATRLFWATDGWVRKFEPWGIVIALVGLSIALITIMIDLEDRNAERTFRAWQIIQQFEGRVASHAALETRVETSFRSLQLLLPAVDGPSFDDNFGVLIPRVERALDSSVPGFELQSVRRDLGNVVDGLDNSAPYYSLVEFVTGEIDATLVAAGAELDTDVGLAGSSLREALEFLNRDFEGRVCGFLVRWVSDLLTGNGRRRCLFPQKEQESFVGFVAYSASLRDVGIPRAKLREADLRRSDLEGSDLRGADLWFANLQDAGLTRVDLRGAVLTGADLRDADLSFANLQDADLASADLRDADLSFANLQDADLMGAVNLTQPQLDATCGTPKNLPDGMAWPSRPCSR